MGITGFSKFIEETFPEAITEELIRNINIDGNIAVDGNNELYVHMHVAKLDVTQNAPIEKIIRACRGDAPAQRELYIEIQRQCISRVLDFILTDLKSRVVWVVDGVNTPALKEETRKLRRERVDKARTTFETSVGDLESDEFANPQRYRKIFFDYISSKPPHKEDFDTLNAILTRLNIPLIRAWGEGEKTCARLCQPELVEDKRYLCKAVWSADTDSLLFGAPILIQRRRATRELGSRVRIYRRDLIPVPLKCLVRSCVANGCDYHPKGIRGLGIKKAFKIYGADEAKSLPDELELVSQLFDHTPLTEPIEICTPETCKLETEVVKWFTLIYG
jgi:hypothetical protein